MKKIISIILSIFMILGVCPIPIEPLFASEYTFTINDFDIGTSYNQVSYYGKWSTSKNYPDMFYNGDEHWVTITESNWDDTYLEITFFGNAIQFYGKKESMAGIQSVSIDGNFIANVDAYQKTSQNKALLFDSSDYVTLENTLHVLTYRPSKTKNEASSGYSMQFDYAQVSADTTGEVIDAVFEENAYQVKMEHTLQVVPTLYPVEATATMTYRSEDESIAQVSQDGVITPKAVGSTTIYVDIEELDKTIQYELEVLENLRENIYDDSLTSGDFAFTYSDGWHSDSVINYGEEVAEHWTAISSSDTELPYFTFNFIGKQIKLYGHTCSYGPIANVYIDDVEVGQIDYYSSSRVNNALLFDSGNISEGPHTIKVQITSDKNEAANGASEAAINKAIVYISEAYYKAKEINLNKSSVYLEVGLDTSLTYSIYPSFAENVPAVIYTSENEEVATVDEDGHILATGAGVTNIVATLEGTDISDSVKVTVRESKEELSAVVSDNNSHRYPDDYLNYLSDLYEKGSLQQRTWKGTGWKNDHLTSRIDIFTRTKAYDDVRIEVSDFVSTNDTITASNIQATYLLAPIDSKNQKRTMDIISDKKVMDIPAKDVTGIWVDVYIPKDASAGIYQGTITLIDGNDVTLAQFDYQFEVLDLLLSDELSTHLELWMYPYSSNRYYSNLSANEFFNTDIAYGKTDITPLYYIHLDPQYEAGLRSQLELYQKAGGDAITVTVVEDAWSTQTPDPYPSMVKWKKKSDGTWEFDYTDLDYWVNLNMEYGIDSQIKSFSLSPWGGRITYLDEASNTVITERVTTGGDRWSELYTIFLTDYMQHMEEKGWFDITYLAMDELSLSQVNPVIDLVHSIANDEGESFKISLAANSYEAESAFDHLDDISLASSLLSRSDVIEHRNEVGLYTTFYTCGGGYGAMANPPGHSAFAIYTSYKHDVKGYLRWALDSFNAEPYETGANPLFVDGDIYLIYPDERGSTQMQAKSSPRYEKFIEGMREVEKLKILEKEHPWLQEYILEFKTNMSRSYSTSVMQEIQQDIIALSKKAVEGEPQVGIQLEAVPTNFYVGDEYDLEYTTYPIDLIETNNNETTILSDDEQISFIGTWSPHSTGAWVGMDKEEMQNYGYEFDFNGNFFEIIGKTEPSLCQLDVYVDDEYIDTIDPYSATTLTNQTIYTSPTLENKVHHVRIIGNGQTNATSEKQYMHLYSITYGSRNDIIFSSDSDAVSVDASGHMVMKQAGSANIKVQFMNYEDRISISVKDKSISFGQDTYYLEVGKQQAMELICDPTDLLTEPKSTETILYNDARLNFVGGWGSDYTGKWINIKNSEDALNKSFSFSFTGHRFHIIGNKENVSGMCDVYIDGEYVDTYNPQSTSRYEQEILYTSDKLDYKEHQVEVKGRGETTGSQYNMHVYAVQIDTFENLVWSMENDEVATLDQQNVNALQVGTTTLNVSSDLYQAQASIVVYDKSALRDALALQLDENLYTTSSWEAYQNAYNEAVIVEANKEVSQAEIDDALQALNNAKDALVEKTISNFSATVTSYKSIQLTWDDVPQASTYIVERYTSDGEWIEVASTNETSYLANGLKTGKVYTYRIKTTLDEVIYSTEVQATPMLSGEVALTITNQDEDQFNLSWTSVEGATRYIIYRKNNDDAYKKILTLGKDVRTYTTKAMAEGTYTYQVKAARYDSIDRVMTQGSNEVEVSVGSTLPNLQMSKQDDTTITLTWDKVVGMNTYMIYRATSENGTYHLLKKVMNTTSIQTSCKEGTTYYYKLRAYKVENDVKVYSPYSNIVSAQ